MDDNKLIAEFMGIENSNGIVFQDANTKEFHLIKYHTSWNWLMPVIERIIDVISPLDEEDEQNLSQTLLYGYKDDVYKLVVEFIKEYNKIKPF